MKSSSTSHSREVWHPRSFTWVLAVVAAASLLETTYAIDPTRAMSQYIHDQWSSESGFPGGSVSAIAQTTDGYLWIGTEKGLVRFDGLNFVLLDHAPETSASLAPVLGLVADTDGSLWVRLRGPTLLRYRNGEIENVMSSLALPDSLVTAMSRARDGAVIISAVGNGVLSYRHERFETIVSPDVLPQALLISLAEGSDGELWMGTRDNGLLRIRGDSVSRITQGLPDQKINCLVPGDNDEVWVGTDSGVVRWNGTEITRDDVPSSFRQIQALAMARDRESNLWVGTTSGNLLRFNARGVSVLDERGSRARGAITALFEDREGSLWIGSARGLERLRDSAFVTYSSAEGLPSETSGPLYVDAEGRTWLAPSDGGLYWMKDGQIERVTTAGLDRDVVYSMAGSQGDVWIGRQRGGLTRLRPAEGPMTAETYSTNQGLAQNSVYAVHQSGDGSVWAGTLSGGVSQLKGGGFTTYTTADGLASNTIAAIAETGSKTMWFATPNGLSALSDGKWRSFTIQDGLPSNDVNSLFEDSKGVLWIGTSKGVAFIDSDRVQVPSNLPATLHEPVLGLAEDAMGSLWIATLNHVLRVTRDALARGSLEQHHMREFGVADGLRGVEGIRRDRSLVADSHGRIWLSRNRGVSVVDPARATSNPAPAMVHIQGIFADGEPLDPRMPLRVPSGRQRLTFSYAGLSLHAPERVRYRYMLDGFDRSWSEPLAQREAVYTNLGAGTYQFRVIASNSDGLWNGSESSLAFNIEPAFWQTWWFRLSSVMIVVLVGFAMYRVRLHQVAKQLNVRFEERLAERTRIAQELHDTLLQGFMSASMQLHVAADQIAADSPAKPALTRVLQLMGQVIEEGRNAVRGLRTPSASSDNLEQAFSRIQDDIASSERVGFRVIVEGRSRSLHPLIRDEVYRVGREALVNAFRHSGAKRIEVELEYAASRLRILVRDNGCGIDPQVLQSGREGHWGLSGMRERAERIGARLKVWSGPSAGTEVELSVPSHIAFPGQPPVGSSKRFTRWLPRRNDRPLPEARERER